MAKLPKGVKTIVEQTIEEQIPHLAWLIKARQDNDASLPSWFKEKSASYYAGLLDGAYNKVESLLMAYNAYNGFREVTGHTIDGAAKKTVPYRHYFL